jgi:chemotaxis protein MotB
MVTFGDCMTLLLTFFVLLLTFSSFDDKAFRKMTTALSTAMPSINVADTRSRDSVFQRDVIIYQPDRGAGSESPTDNPQAVGNVKESLAINLNDRRVFLIPSGEIFVLKGTQFSEKGKRLLATVATFLKAFPNKIVVSENRLQGQESAGSQGFKRAWSIVDYLTQKGPLKQERFAISGTSTVPYRNLPPRLRQSHTGRLLEIVLLDRAISQ